MIWEPQFECMDGKERRDLQLRRLKDTVARVWERRPAYRRLMEERGVRPEHINSLEDVRLLPFTTKSDLRDSYPYGMFAVSMDQVVRLHASSGTTGKPTVVGYTRNDLETWSNLVARVVTQAGVTSRDVAQVCFGYGLFTGGFGLHYGLERVGAAVVPASSGNTARQIMLMKDFGVTALVSTPSYSLHMAEVARDEGIDPHDLKVRVGLFGAEPWTESMRKEIEKTWGLRATDNYGLSEIIGPGVAGECEVGGGMHISEDHFLAEIINPGTGEPLPYGEKGELVITTLTKEALPLIRYRTKDVTALNPEPCKCGRTTARMQKVLGRSDDMLVIRGVNVFPSQIENVLMNINGLAPHYMVVVNRRGYLDELEVHVELTSEKFTGSFRDLEAFERRIASKLQNALSIQPKVKLVEYRSLERSMGKAKRVIDNRPK
ncbi:MAG: phenylacetate--CoA ligase [Firmicutes bacterium]|nr:phenylacetate--CoA ligase [Bacillota bacterium]